MGHSDRIALDRWAAHRDAEAFREIVTRHSAMVLSTCWRILGNGTEAEDVTQECFEALAQSDNVTGSNVGPWLHRVATNISIKRIRSDSRRKEREKRFASQRSAHTELEWQDIYQYVDEALAELPDKYRIPIVAHFLQNESQSDIAKGLNVSPQTVSHRIKRAVYLLGKALRRRGIRVAAVALASMLAANLAEASPVPSSLAASLGKLALAHSTKATGVQAAADLVNTIGGTILVKKIAVAVIVILAPVVFWIATHEGSEKPDISIPTVSTKTEEAPSVPRSAPSAPDRVMIIPEPKGGTVSGRVYDAKTERGIAGVVIRATASGPNGTRVLSEPTDSSGSYRISSLLGSGYQIACSDTPAGYREPAFSEGISVSLEPGQEVNAVDFPLEREVPLSGIVLDSQRNAVPMATVMLHGGTNRPVAASVESGRDGTFCFHNLGPTEGLSLQAKTESGLVSPHKLFSLPEDGLRNVELIVDAASVVSGAVFDSKGAPVPNIEIIASPNGNKRVYGIHRTSNELGTYSLDGLAAGVYVLNLPEWPHSEHGEGVSNARFELAANEEISNLDLLYERGTLSITGRVAYADGRPIADAKVLCGNSRGSDNEVVTDADGCYVLSGLEDGIYGVFVHKYTRSKGIEFDLSRQFVRAGSKGVDFVVKERILGVQVVDAQTSKPLGEFEYAFVNSRESMLDASLSNRFQQVIDTDGCFELTLPLPKRYLLAVRAVGYSTALLPVVPNDGQSRQDVVVRLARGYDLHGIVRNEDGERIGGAGVFYGEPNANFGPAARTAPDGTFTLQSFPDSAQSISVQHPSYATRLVGIPPKMDLSNPLIITLEHGGAIQGGVALPESIERESCRVFVRYPQFNAPLRYADITTDGSFSFSQLPSGEASVHLQIRVSSWYPCTRGPRQIVDVRNNETSVIHFDVPEADAVLEGNLLFHDWAQIEYARTTLSVVSPSGEEEVCAVAGNDGFYRMEDIPAGDGVLRILLVRTGTGEHVEASLPIELSAGMFLHQDIDVTDMLR
ncbi:MAG TPA: sigma-70 family RNA polymerase sigma factor [Candidatus Hydrogenedentes bacterium]|nr:sigma-70 family RNA polymerase sigma factor [Candidatus Hydrogenedentota bacterium]HQM49741.1 sigma-70 family RNA polymerase sigma factor [Candidatus Hydrogenedentota bacterium]